MEHNLIFCVDNVGQHLAALGPIVQCGPEVEVIRASQTACPRFNSLMDHFSGYNEDPLDKQVFPFQQGDFEAQGR